MSENVVIYVQPGTVSHDRQLQLCLEFCHRHGYHVASVVPPHGAADAVGVVLAGVAALIVAAFAARARPGDIRDLASEHHVRVEYVRPPVVRKEVADVVVRVYRNTGRDIKTTARLLEVDTGAIRSALARLGIRPSRGNGTTPDSRE